MKRDFKTVITLLAFSLPVLAIVFIGAIYFANCGLNTDCSQASMAQVIHTPIPTLIAATLPIPTPAGPAPAGTGKCSVAAEPLLAAWVNSGFSDTAPFTFTDANNANCQATFADVQPLFLESNLWYSGALACASCHNANIAAASAHMDLSSYAGMLAGGNRTSGSANGEDLFGGGNWDQSKLNQMLFVLKLMPFGRPVGAVADQGPVILAGTQVASAIGTTPTAPEETEVAARPSNNGGPGQAVNLTGDPKTGALVYQSQCSSCHGDNGLGGVSNPGSTDGTVPPLNPIDSTLVSADYKTYATNLDLFIQHGSSPEGPSPFRNMPAWGDTNSITQQQIADVIAYIISLNK